MGEKQLPAEATKLPRNCLNSTPDYIIIQMVQGNHEMALIKLMAKKIIKIIKMDDEINE